MIDLEKCAHCGETDCGPGERWAAPQRTEEQLVDAREAEDERRAQQASVGRMGL